MKNNTPSCLISWLFRRFMPWDEWEYFISALQPVYEELYETRGRCYARIWFWRQWIRSLPDFIKNACTGRFTMFLNYLKMSYRNIVKHKGFSFITVFGLAAGLAAFILIALYVQFELSFDRYHENADRIYRMVREKPTSESTVFTKTAVTPAPLGPALKEEFPEVVAYARLFKSQNVLITCGNEHFLERRFYWADPGIFDIFSLPMIKGNPKTALDDPFAILMSERTARKYFGDDDPLGKVVNAFGGNDFKVAGVFSNMPANSHFIMDVIVPYQTFFKITENDITRWGSNFTYTYFMLREGGNPKALENKCPAFLDKYVYQYYDIPDNQKNTVSIQPLTSIHLYSHRNEEIEPNNDITNIILFSSLAVLFLLIACINYMNLVTARSVKRSREVGIRKVIGAQRRQLIKQFLGESVAMTVLAMIFSIILVQLALPAFNRLVERDLSFNPVTSPQLFFSLVVIILVVGLLSGSYPALLISSFKPASVLGGTALGSSKGSPFRNVLVLIQFSITIIFLIFTFIVKAQLHFVKNRDMGYGRDQILTMEVRDMDIGGNIEAIKSELKKHTDILAVSTSYRLPNNIDEHNNAEWPGRPPDKVFHIYYNMADYEFVDLFDIQIVEGRNFSKEFPSDANGAFLVNEAAVKAAEWKSPIGQEFYRYGDKVGKIVGVMKDFHLHSLHRPIDPLYIYLDPGHFSYISIKMKSTDIPATIDYVKGVMKKIVPNCPFEYTFFDEVFARDYHTEQRMSTIFGSFAILAIIVACLGLLGLASYTTEQRTKEIGIRKVLGASEPKIFLLLSKEFLKWVVLSNIIAWPIAYIIIRQWLQGFAYRVNIGITIFAFAAVLALGIAILTVSYQTIKAARANPVNALKYE
jgi:putative ABC transport system permease protein